MWRLYETPTTVSCKFVEPADLDVESACQSFHLLDINEETDDVNVLKFLIIIVIIV